MENDYKFQSFAPDETLTDTTSKKYLKQLRDLMEHPSVTNIAITGDLGVGKSTLIRNYEQIHKEELRSGQKYFYLSVNDLKIEELDTAPNRLEQAQEKLRQELEVRLLKQLLVVCEKKDIAGCHYQPVPERKSPVIPFIFTAAAVLLMAWGLGFLDNLAYWEYDLWLMILVLLLTVVVVWFAARQLHIHYKTPSFSLRFGSEQNGGSADAAPDTDAELLDKYLMDIVYVMETVYEKSGGVLVIEDLDRYGSEVCVPILEKFREINILINQRLRSKGKKPFRFLYVLRDDIFAELSEDEPSTVPPSKFFDGLLTIVPQLGYANSVDFLTEKWKRYELEPKFLLAISPYVYDYRQIRAIENEYQIFRSVAKENCKGLNITNTAIMAFCVYRHFYPAEYYDIRKNPEHELVKYLMEKELYRIQKKINSQSVFTLLEPTLPKDERMAMLFGFMQFNVLACMFPGNATVELLRIFDQLHAYLWEYLEQPKLSIPSSVNACLQLAVPEYSYQGILDLLNRNPLQTDEFKLIFASYLITCSYYEKNPNEMQQILDTQDKMYTDCQKTNGKRFALCYANVLFNATVEMNDPDKRLEQADKIKALLDEYRTAEIALEYAMALFNAANKMNDPDKRLEQADRIKALLDEYRTAEIALQYAMALVNAANKMNDPDKMLKQADRIKALLDEYRTAEIALEYAKALVNATAKMNDPDKRLEQADRIKALLDEYKTAEIALEYAKALFNATNKMDNPDRILEQADKIKALLDEYSTAEIALRYAKVLVSATNKMDNPDRILDTADRYRADLLSDPALWSAGLNMCYGWIIENAEVKIPTNPTHRAPLEARLNEHKEYLEQLKAAHPSP